MYDLILAEGTGVIRPWLKPSAARACTLHERGAPAHLLHVHLMFPQLEKCKVPKQSHQSILFRLSDIPKLDELEWARYWLAD